MVSTHGYLVPNFPQREAYRCEPASRFLVSRRGLFAQLFATPSHTWYNSSLDVDFPFNED